MSRRKPSPGVCGQCGRAVVRATPEQVEERAALPFVDALDFWIQGHHYVDGRLVQVRCRDHEPSTGWDNFGEWRER